MVKKLQLYQLDKSRMTADRIGELKALLTTDPKKYRAFVLLKPIMGKIEREVAEIMEDDEMYNFDAFDEFCST
ncbi:MAG: hypothetical protein OEY79_05095, partial [Anaplasmataceae bacterium]|nr:hypothetical protein [Anaplasmataceae bacterium]